MARPDPFQIDLSNVTHVVIEVFGGDNNLSSYVIEDLQEMAAGNRGPFGVIGLADAEDGEAKVMALTPGAGLHVVESLGEIDTGDPETLASFLSRSLVTARNVPHKAIGFWDHGSGVFDEHDPNETYLERRLRAVPRHRRSRSVPARRLFVSPSQLASHPRLRAMLHDDTNGGVLTNYEAHGVLKAAFSRAGFEGKKVDLIFSDTCLNGMIEVLEQFKEFTEVVIGSEDLEPGDGWEYQEWFGLMSDSPPADAAAWGRQAIEGFEAGYKNRPDQFPCTLAAFRTDNQLTDAMKGLVEVLSPHASQGMSWLKLAVLDSQSFARRDTYDIRDFAEKLKSTAAANDVKASCDQIIAAFDNSRVHSAALGRAVQKSNGLAFWYPTSNYSFESVKETYEKLFFDQRTGWTAYLTNYRFA
jgi:Clostripain family